MKDAEYNLVKDYCLPLAKKWITLMGCSWDRVDLHWADHYFNEEKDGHPAECMAFCDADWRYLHATITFSCAKIFEHFTPSGPKEPEFIEEMIIHEIGHILVSEMREYDRSNHNRTVGHEERVVTRMARAFLYTYQQGRASAEQVIVGTDEQSGSANSVDAQVDTADSPPNPS